MSQINIEALRDLKTLSLVAAYNTLPGVKHATSKSFKSKDLLLGRISDIVKALEIDGVTIAFDGKAFRCDEDVPTVHDEVKHTGSKLPAPESVPAPVEALDEPAKAAPEVKAATPAKTAKPMAQAKAADGAKAPSKRQIMIDMVLRKEGATEAEICSAIGWKACLVTLRRVAEAQELSLRSVKEPKEAGGKSRYFASKT
jgi:hypothetical protein